MNKEELIGVREQAEVIVRQVGEFVLSFWDTNNNVSYKEGREPVTAIDTGAEDMLVEKLSGIVSGAGFIREEGEDDVQDEYNWTIDPIDQTKNFIGKIPLFYVQVALVRKGEPVLGVIYNPVSKQLFSSSEGDGAWLNGTRVNPTWEDSLLKAMVELDIGGNDQDTSWRLECIGKLLTSAYRVRVTAGALSPYLLTGGVDAYVVLNEKTKIVDQMPRRALFKEAGFDSREINLEGRKVVVYAGKPLADEIEQLFREKLSAFDGVGGEWKAG